MSNTIFTDLTKTADAATKEIRKTVTAIFDENSFVETDRFITGNTEIGEATGEGVIAGFAYICDVRVALFATNPQVLKGSIGKTNAQKIVKLIQFAVRTGMPVISILDTAGARFAEGIDAMEGYAAIQAALCEAYGNVPTVTVVKGADFGLSSYFAAVTDLCIAYKAAQIATSSPLILAGSGKEDPAKIGTGAALGETSDIVTHVVDSDKDVRNIISAFLTLVTDPVCESDDDPNRTAKAAALKKPDDMLKEILDKNTVLPVRNGFAAEVKTGFARLDGIAVGYVCTTDKLTADGAGKVTELLNTCESFGLPVLNFVHCAGVKTCPECDAKTLRAVSDMVYTYNCMTSPKLALIYGDAVGIGYTAFAAKHNALFSIAWADAKIGIMESAAAAELVYADTIAAAKDKEKAREKCAVAYAEENQLAPVVAAKGYLDNVIDPALSRPYLASALQIFAEKE